MVAGYIDYLKADKKSERTIATYTKYVQQMLNFVCKDECDITLADLNIWRNSLSHLSSASIALEIKSIKNYFNYLTDMDIINQNPAVKLKAPVIKNREKEYVSESMVDSMIQCATNIRDKAILLLLKKNGLRVNELINLTIDQYLFMKKYNQHYFKITGKGDKERNVYFTDELIQMIDKYLSDRNDQCDRLFVSHWGGPIHSNNLSQTLKTIAKKANIPFWENISNHYMRVACATIYSEKGVPVSEIRDLLNHSNISVTNTYLKTNPDTIYDTVMLK